MNTHPSTASRKQDRQALEARRLQAGRLFAKGKTQAEVARTCGATKVAVHNWHFAWKKGGLNALRSKGRPGPKSYLSENDRGLLAKELMKGARHAGYATEFWTLERIAKLIRIMTGASYHPSSVWHVLSSMGWSCQRPEQRMRERDEAAIRRWVRDDWPRIQKKGSA